MQHCNKVHLRQNIYIRKLIAISLVLIFALSITPTKVLHFFFANHQDEVARKTGEPNKLIISISGYNCQCNNLVVVSPFIPQNQVISFEIPIFLTLQKSAAVADLYFITPFFSELRGPPSLA